MAAVQAGAEVVGATEVVVSFDIGIKNLAVAVLVASGEEASVPVWRILPLVEEGRNAKRARRDDLSVALFQHLDALVEEIQAAGHPVIHHVLIENQPSRINGSMKTIQTWIQAYFALRKHWMGEVDDVHLVSAAHKTQGHDRAMEDAEVAAVAATPRATKAAGYAYNKKMAVALARYYIAGDVALAADFAANGAKRDDLADALLQAIAWLRKRGVDVGRVVRMKGT
jgi:hypothetical protein